MTEAEWTSGMMVADEQILSHIEEIEHLHNGKIPRSNREYETNSASLHRTSVFRQRPASDLGEVLVEVGAVVVATAGTELARGDVGGGGQEVLAFIDRFLLGRKADTSDVRIVSIKGQ